MATFGFDEQSARRIIDATKRSEATPERPSGGRTPTLDASNGFWAEIGEQDATDKDRYKWHKLRIVDGELVDTDPLIDSGTFYSARSASSLTNVVPTTRVWMTFAGYEGAPGSEGREARYLFPDPPAQAAVVAIASSATANGEYLATMFKGLSTSTASTYTARATGDAVLFINHFERGTSVHSLTVGDVGIGVIVGRQSDGRWIVEGHGFKRQECEPEGS